VIEYIKKIMTREKGKNRGKEKGAGGRGDKHTYIT
jgi:hypothetical protein